MQVQNLIANAGRFTQAGFTEDTPVINGTVNLHATVIGSGSVAAVVKVQGSNTPKNPNAWIDTGVQVTLSGTNSATGSASADTTFAFHRIVVMSMTNGATVHAATSGYERTPSGDVVGGGVIPGTVEDGLLVVEHGGADFAMLPKIGTGVKANLSVRTGLKASLLSLSGNSGEIAMTTDTRELVLFNGVAGQAIVASASALRVVSGDASSYKSVSTTLGATEPGLVLQNTGANSRWFDGSTVTVAPRSEGSTFRIVSDTSVLVGSGGLKTPPMPSDSTYMWKGGAVVLVSCVGSAPDGSTVLGQDATFSEEAAPAKGAILIGKGARFSNANEISFGPANFSGAPGVSAGSQSPGFLQLYGRTTTSGQVLTLTPEGTAGNGFLIDWAVAPYVYSIELTVIGKKDATTDVAHFKRQLLVKLSDAFVPTVVIPATPNNASDVLDASMAGAALAFDVDATAGTLKVNVTGPTAASSVRWYAVGFAVKMGNS